MPFVQKQLFTCSIYGRKSFNFCFVNNLIPISWSISYIGQITYSFKIQKLCRSSLVIEMSASHLTQKLNYLLNLQPIITYFLKFDTRISSVNFTSETSALCFIRKLKSTYVISSLLFQRDFTTTDRCLSKQRSSEIFARY